MLKKHLIELSVDSLWLRKYKQLCIICASSGIRTFVSELTGAFDGDLQLPSASSFCVHLEVCGLLYPEALRLQTTTLRSAEAGVTRCGQAHSRHSSEYCDSNIRTTYTFSRLLNGNGLHPNSTCSRSAQR